MARRSTVFIDSFSGAASDLKGKNRTSEKVLEALGRSPRVSTWDMVEHAWLCRCLLDLKKRGLIEEANEPYPWHRYVLTKAGNVLIGRDHAS